MRSDITEFSGRAWWRKRRHWNAAQPIRRANSAACGAARGSVGGACGLCPAPASVSRHRPGHTVTAFPVRPIRRAVGNGGSRILCDRSLQHCLLWLRHASCMVATNTVGSGGRHVQATQSALSSPRNQTDRISRMRAGILTVLLGILCAGPALAGTGTGAPLDLADEGAPTFTVYSSREGLSDEIWSTVGFDAKGFVWAGSASSLARFDGYRWTPWPFAEARSLVRDMQTDSDGALWAIFEREGLVRYDGSRWNAVSGLEQVPPTFFRLPGGPTARRTSGSALTPASGISRAASGGPTPATHRCRRARSRASNRPNRCSADRANGWRRRIDGLWFRELDRRRIAESLAALRGAGIRWLALHRLMRTRNGDDEELWVLSYGDGLARIRNDGIRIWRAANGELPTEAMYSAQAT